MSNAERRPHSRPGIVALRLLLRAGLLFGVGVAILQTAILGPILPGELASRFSLAGEAIGWIPTPQFLVIHLAIVATLATAFLGVPVALRLCARRQDAQRAATLEDVADFEARTLLFGLATMTFTILLVHLVLRGNLVRPAHLGPSAAVLVATYLAFAATWAVQVVRRHRSRADTASHAAVSAVS